MALGNARELDRLGERRIPVLRQLLESSVDQYATLIAGRRDGGPVETLSGPEDPATMTAALVGEQLVHGFDLARAIGRRWTIDPFRSVPADRGLELARQTGSQGEALGNFPQAFTHLALISAAFNLDRMLGSQV